MDDTDFWFMVISGLLVLIAGKVIGLYWKKKP